MLSGQARHLHRGLNYYSVGYAFQNYIHFMLQAASLLAASALSGHRFEYAREMPDSVASTHYE